MDRSSAFFSVETTCTFKLRVNLFNHLQILEKSTVKFWKENEQKGEEKQISTGSQSFQNNFIL
ncbi:MAG: hypothetical protein AYK18_17620 [Theionarchaea archaeon DG-70]|nr:MAG: hypothetical protein AYK18_17620 [Theionarchaea archaeon DG-70]